MKIDFDDLADEVNGIVSNAHYEGDRREENMMQYKEAVKYVLRKACNQVLDEAIRSFPSHEHPEIAKSILKIKEEL